jgi:hypothetical protein
VLLLNPSSAPPFYLSYADLLLISEFNSGAYAESGQLTGKIARRTGAELRDLNFMVRHLLKTDRLRLRQDSLPAVAVPVAEITPARDTAWIDRGQIAVKAPIALRQVGNKFQVIDYEGQLVAALSPAEVNALGQFTKPTSFRDGFEKQKRIAGRDAVRERQLRKLLAHLDAAKLVVRAQEDSDSTAPVAKLSRAQVNRENFARQAAEQDAREAERERQTGKRRTKVIPVWSDESIPTALGLVVAYAKAYEDGKLEEAYNFRLDWVWHEDRFDGYTQYPAVYLFSNYLWSHERSIELSKKIKERSPNSITIHGGPDTPKYEQDALEYFEKYPQVDIVVRGEGEASAAETLDKLSAVMGQEDPDLHGALQGVAGISYRYKGKVYRNPDRERIADLDSIPSPLLTGLFDVYAGVPRLHVTLETNRGCPYGCTFCDWGSATTSKIRKFDLDRVLGELEWCSRMKVESISQADANFGVFERDVTIAEKVGELKRTTGYPWSFGGSYAKNSTKYLEKIIHVMAESGILTQGVLSLQTMDDATLSAINRSNIKVEKYDALANEMRRSNLQLTVELMMGLPGATLEGFIEDLQQCIDRDVQARIHQTTMLVNAPMNHPDYRETHQIETGSPLGPGKMPVLVATSTYTRDDMERMKSLRELFILLDNFGILRLVSRYVHHQTGMLEMDFYQKLVDEAGRPDRDSEWPLLSTLVNQGQNLMAPVYSWSLVMDELRGFLVRECGVADDSALTSILRAQQALLPSWAREYPAHLELEHDVVGWHEQMIAAKETGHFRDWVDIVPPLASFGPGSLTVDDVDGAVTGTIGCDIGLSANGVNWDMVSAIGRARVAQDTDFTWAAEKEPVLIEASRA